MQRQTSKMKTKKKTKKKQGEIVIVDICISVSLSLRKDRQWTINNICLAFSGSDPKQGNVHDVSALLLGASSRNEDIKVAVFCELYFSNLNFSVNNKTNSVITLTSFAYWYALSLSHSLSPSLPPPPLRNTPIYTCLNRSSASTHL